MIARAPKNHGRWLALVAGLTLSAACSDKDAAIVAVTVPDGGGDTSPAAPAPLYGFVTVAFSDTGSTTYVNLVDSLDVTSIDLKDAREFPGYAPVNASGGKIFVASGESPTVTRFAASGDGAWTEDGMAGFGAYLSDGGPASIFVSPTKAFVDLDVVGHVVWDPATLTISGTEPGPTTIPLLRDTMTASRGYDFALREGRLFEPYYWADKGFDRFAPVSQIAVWDTDTNKVRGVLDAACPHLHIATKDDAGNIYFSNGSLSGTAPLVFKGDPKNCIVRIKAGEETLDPTFLVHFADVTDGREGAGFRYLGNGKGFFAAFHGERLTIAPDADPKKVNYSANWRLWTLDLATLKAAPIDGFDYFGGQYTAFTFEGRTFVLLPTADYKSTTTYELSPTGVPTKRFESTGWVFNMFRAR